jgi:hypothetical protein
MDKEHFPHGYPESKPATIAQAIDILDVLIEPKDKELIKAMKEDELIGLHFFLGLAIRNNFGLWQGNESLMRELVSIYPDDASSVLIEAYWKHLQNEHVGFRSLANSNNLFSKLIRKMKDIAAPIWWNNTSSRRLD